MFVLFQFLHNWGNLSQHWVSMRFSIIRSIGRTWKKTRLLVYQEKPWIFRLSRNSYRIALGKENIENFKILDNIQVWNVELYEIITTD